MNPTTPYQAKFSLAYCVAVALLEGDVGLEQFTPERFDPMASHPAIAAFLSRIRVTVVDELTRKYPAAWPTRVVLSLRDG